MRNNSYKEVFGNEARLQLSFFSYLKVALFICFGISVSGSVFLNLVGKGAYDPSVNWYSVSMWITTYVFLGSFALGVVGAILMYPVYSIWCSKQKGQRVTGKFAVLVKEQ